MSSAKPFERDATSQIRRGQIVRELRRNGKVLVNDLAEQLKISSSTIRRDLAELENDGMLRRTHGGAVPIEQFLYDRSGTCPRFRSETTAGRREAPDRHGSGRARS